MGKSDGGYVQSATITNEQGGEIVRPKGRYKTIWFPSAVGLAWAGKRGIWRPKRYLKRPACIYGIVFSPGEKWGIPF